MPAETAVFSRRQTDVSRWEVEEKSVTEMAGEEGQRLREVVLQVADQVEETLVLQTQWLQCNHGNAMQEPKCFYRCTFYCLLPTQRLK